MSRKDLDKTPQQRLLKMLGDEEFVAQKKNVSQSQVTINRGE